LTNISPIKRHPLAKWLIRAKAAVLRAWQPVRQRFRKPADPFQLNGPVPSEGEPLAFALLQSLGVRFDAGHSVSWILNGDVFEALEKEIAEARSSIHVLMYIWKEGTASDRIVRALVERASAGVACRIVVDPFGSSDFDDTVRAPLEAAGCEIRTFRPLSGKHKAARNHRKLVVIDGARAVTGGFGIRDNWLGDGVHDEKWRDSSVRFAGPSVADAQQAFAENWQEAGGNLLPREAFPSIAPEGHARAAFVSSTGAALTRAERLTQLLIAAATHRIWISNAYFVPTRGIAEQLRVKATAGVDVRILVPGKRSDSKTSFGVQRTSEYGPLLKAGARVWEYQSSMMHAKTMLVNDSLVLVGSINLDPLSLSVLEECALVTEDRALAQELARAFAIDCAHATER
jgi:cardiolipin synthase